MSTSASVRPVELTTVPPVMRVVVMSAPYPYGFAIFV
jgi:hypothetical protein